MLGLCLELSNLITLIVNKINLNTTSDISVALDLLEASSKGAFSNILINLKEIQDSKYKNETFKKSENIKNKIIRTCRKNEIIINNILNE